MAERNSNPQFARECESARHAGVVQLEKKIRECGDWRAWKWLLSVWEPDLYATAKREAITPQVMQAIVQITVDAVVESFQEDIPPERRAACQEKLGKALSVISQLPALSCSPSLPANQP